MNKPVVAGGKRKDGDWLPALPCREAFRPVHRLDQLDRLARHRRQWVRHLTRHGEKDDGTWSRLVSSIGPGSPWTTSGFVPAGIADDLQFISVAALRAEEGEGCSCAVASVGEAGGDRGDVSAGLLAEGT